MTLSYNFAHQEIILVHPTRRRIFAGKPYSTFWNIWEWVICKVFVCSKVRTASIHRPAPHHHTLPRPLTHQIESQTLPRQSAETFPRSSAHTQTLPRPISRVDNTQVGRLLNIYKIYLFCAFVHVYVYPCVCLCLRVSGCVYMCVTVLWRRGWGPIYRG